eukprot:350322-Chlamydomonas_euryale.AAC.2
MPPVFVSVLVLLAVAFQEHVFSQRMEAHRMHAARVHWGRSGLVGVVGAYTYSDFEPHSKKNITVGPLLGPTLPRPRAPSLHARAWRRGAPRALGKRWRRAVRRKGEGAADMRRRTGFGADGARLVRPG